MNDAEPMTEYVTAAAWTNPAGRADHIDEIADHFERPGAADFWSGTQAGWPTAHRRAAATPHWIERRAG